MGDGKQCFWWRVVRTTFFDNRPPEGLASLAEVGRRSGNTSPSYSTSGHSARMNGFSWTRALAMAERFVQILSYTATPKTRPISSPQMMANPKVDNLRPARPGAVTLWPKSLVRIIDSKIASLFVCRYSLITFYRPPERQHSYQSYAVFAQNIHNFLTI